MRLHFFNSAVIANSKMDYSLTFFHADINQSEAEDSFQLASDWIKSVYERM